MCPEIVGSHGGGVLGAHGGGGVLRAHGSGGVLGAHGGSVRREIDVRISAVDE